jgi:small subunit ribosomal protein S8
MGMTDPIADLLTRIRNGSMASRPYIDAPFSKIKAEIARILKNQGYIKGYTTSERTLRIYLKYTNEGERTITEIKRISKPGCRVYRSKENLPKVLNGLGIAIVSTSKGVFTDREARLANVGGEILCTVW